MGFPLYDAPGGGGAAAAAASGGGGAVAQLRAHQSMVAQGRRTVPRFSYIGDSDSEEDDMYVHSTSMTSQHLYTYPSPTLDLL